MSEPYYEDGSVCLWQGDALEVLEGLPSGSVDCVVTSPPYYGLRDYGVDGQIGLEETPEEYVSRLAGVFREVGRVLRDDGTLWLNLADSYAGSGKGRRSDGTRGGTVGKQSTDRGSCAGRLNGPCRSVRRKSLLGIPWRVAFALMDDGWILRNDIVWHKRNAMPSSAVDRLTVKHEDLFLLTRQEHYRFNLDAIKVPASMQSQAALSWDRGSTEPDRPGQTYRQHRPGRGRAAVSGPALSNPGDVWDIPNQPFKAAHYATFPEALPSTCIKAGCLSRGGGGPRSVLGFGNDRPGRPKSRMPVCGHRHQPRLPGTQPEDQAGARNPGSHVVSETKTLPVRPRRDQGSLSVQTLAPCRGRGARLAVERLGKAGKVKHKEEAHEAMRPTLGGEGKS